MNISFTAQQEKYINAQLERGDFKNASEIVLDALHLHQIYRHRVIEDSRAEVAKGWDGAKSSCTATQIAQEKSAHWSTMVLPIEISLPANQDSEDITTSPRD